jgi:hypothetical protein
MSNNAQRQAAWRARQRSGLIIVPVVWNEAAAVAMLERSGLWTPGQDYTRQQLQTALQYLCAKLQDAST